MTLLTAPPPIEPAPLQPATRSLENFRLDRRIAVVTGGMGKLGALWIAALLGAGASVAALDRPSIAISPLFQTLQEEFGPNRLKAYEADVTCKDSLKQARDKIEQELGRVTILVNNAGIDQPPEVMKTCLLQDIPPEAFARVLDVNTLGAFLCMQVFGEGMVDAGLGSIINIGSLYATVSPDERLYDHLAPAGEPPFLKPPAYGASKAALYNLTRYFAAHWGKHGIRANLLSPGGVEGGQDPAFKTKFTARVPLTRMAGLDDLSGPLLFLASEASRYVTGTELKVDGGFSVW